MAMPRCEHVSRSFGKNSVMKMVRSFSKPPKGEEMKISSRRVRIMSCFSCSSFSGVTHAFGAVFQSCVRVRLQPVSSAMWNGVCCCCCCCSRMCVCADGTRDSERDGDRAIGPGSTYLADPLETLESLIVEVALVHVLLGHADVDLGERLPHDAPVRAAPAQRRRLFHGGARRSRRAVPRLLMAAPAAHAASAAGTSSCVGLSVAFRRGLPQWWVHRPSQPVFEFTELPNVYPRGILYLYSRTHSRTHTQARAASWRW